MSLDKFLQELIVKDSGGECHKLLKEKVAYKVDEPKGKALRDKFQMGGFHCCDYIVPERHRVLLIENSSLLASKEKLELDEKWRSLEDEKIKGIIAEERIREEQVLKAYASLFLLCSLTSQCEKAKRVMGRKKLHFWLIVTDVNPREPMAVLLQNIKVRLEGTLSPLVKVKVFPIWEADRIFKKVDPIRP